MRSKSLLESAGELSLEKPKDKPNPVKDKPNPVRPHSGKAKFVANARGKSERREGGERREEIRFEQGRRTGKDRRPAKGWVPGKNI